MCRRKVGEATALNGIPLERISEGDLFALRDNVVHESRVLDYKEAVGTDREAKKEALKDMSAFANTVGGDLLVGVREGPPGVPAEFPGIPLDQVDGLKLHLGNLLRDNLEPRIQGFSMHPVPLSGDPRAVLVVRIPRSWAAPHAVDFSGHWRFYHRTAASQPPRDSLGNGEGAPRRRSTGSR